MENGERKTENGKRRTENGERKTDSPFRSPLSVLHSPFSVLCSLFSILCSLALAEPAKFPAFVSPIEAVRELDRLADQYRIGKNLSAVDQVFNQKLKQRILRGTFNLRELAKLALAKHWPERSVQEQGAFVELLTQLLEERSVFAKEQAAEKGEEKSYQIDYKKEKFLNKERTQALVNTVVRLKKHRTQIDLNYKLRRADGEAWRIYDVIVDDASLVDNYRSSFGNIIRKNGYPELVRRMENKLKEFRAKRT